MLTVESVLADDALRHRAFPVTRELAYLAHAAVAPLPAVTVDAITGLAQRAGSRGQFEYLLGDAELQVRGQTAAMLAVSADEVALVPSTSAGLSMVAAGLEWRQGDNVVVEAGDFPSNTYAWRSLRRLGVQVREVEVGPVPLSRMHLRPHVDERTRLVALSSTHYLSGRPVDDLCGIGRWLRGIGILLCVDAIQTLGAQPLCGRHIDFTVADGHKWLLAPKGMGVLSVRRELFPILRPAVPGWRSVEDHRTLRVQETLASTARRYESGSLNEMGLVGLAASLGLLAQVGQHYVTERLRAARLRLVDGLRALDIPVLGTPELRDWGAIVSFHIPGTHGGEVARELQRAGVVVSVRHDASGAELIRAAPHFYTTDDDIDRLLDALSGHSKCKSRHEGTKQ
ncbi:aminotransferase class V-fold PLP-dependent enzyme [Brachybacterium sp. GPGPB12]|uniref:aminotransferase class V-fold PLP-dependent enzyme n=1 Tax=Brachybacterium sp. GPGPB12 TaxID=3023517 RepID=UPI0031345A60